MFDLTKSGEKGSNSDYYSPSPSFSPTLSPGPRIDLLPRLRASQQITEQPQAQVTAPVISPLAMKMLPSHQDTPQLSGLQSAWAKSTIESPLGQLMKPLVEKVSGKKVDTSTLAEPSTLGEKALSFVGTNVADLPLWMTGDAVLAKPLAALSKLKPVAKATSLVPKFALPALGTGVRAGASYGLPVNLAETATNGDGLQGFEDRLKQVPMMALGGTALHGAGQLLGKGIKGANNAILDRKATFPTLPTTPQQEALNSFRAPSLRDVKTQQYNKLFNEDLKPTRAEPQQPFSPNGLNPLQRLPLQQGIDNTVGIKNSLSPFERSQKQGDLAAAFKGLPNSNKYSFTTGEQRALSELQDGMQTAQNYIGHADVLAGYPAGTTVQQAYADIAKNTGVDLPKLMGNWEKAQATKTSLTPQELRLGKVSGVLPDLKPRNGLKTLETTQPNILESPLQRTLPKKPQPLTWTNKDGIQSTQKPFQSMDYTTGDKLQPELKLGNNLLPRFAQEQGSTLNPNNLGLLPKLQPIQPKNNLGPLLPPKLDLPLTRKMEMAEASTHPVAEHSLMVDGTFSTALPEPQSKIIIGKSKEPFSFSNAWNKFYTGVVNTQQPIINAAKVAESDMGKLASNTKNVSGIVDYNFLKAMVDKNGTKVGESLKSTVEAIPKGQEEGFWTYMSQRHNIDRAREGKPVQANYTPNMSAEAVNVSERAHPEYKTIGDGITKWIDDFMKTWGVDTGIVNNDIYQGLRKTYKSYFPTQRDFSALEKAIPDNVSQKFSNQKTPIKKATGSERDIIDPIENIMQLVDRTIRTAKYNEVGQSLLAAVKENPIKMKQFAEVITTKDGMFAKTDNVISVLVDGKPTYLQINNKMLLDSMNGLPKSIGNIPVLSTLTNGFKGLVTQKNPLFAIRNIFRDVPTSYVYGSESNPLKFGAGLLGAGKDILTNSPRLQKYQAVGGGGANFFNSGDITKSATELISKGKRDTLVNGLSGKVGDSRVGKIAVGTVDNLLHPIKAVEKFNNLTETAPRLAEFNRVFDKTGDVTKALYAANDVSVNFSRGGNLTKSVDRGVPYLNAGVQGLDKFFRGFANPKTALATIVKAGVAITAPDLALYLINKDDPYYQALDNRTKDSNFLIPRGDGTFIKIPKSRELGVLFGSLFERGLRAAEGQKDPFKGYGNALATSFAPANPIDSNFFSPATWNLATNKDFADRAIVPQSMIMDKRSPYLQYDDKTSSIAKAIGESSRNPLLPGGLSPKQIDYLIKSYTGVIGQFGIPLATPGGSPGKVLTSQFVADPTFSNQATTDFYDKLDKLSTTAVDKNILQKIPSKKVTPEEDMRNSMNEVSSALSRGTKLINSLQASSDSQKDDKIKAIKIQMLGLTRNSSLANDPSSMKKIANSSKLMFTK